MFASKVIQTVAYGMVGAVGSAGGYLLANPGCLKPTPPPSTTKVILDGLCESGKIAASGVKIVAGCLGWRDYALLGMSGVLAYKCLSGQGDKVPQVKSLPVVKFVKSWFGKPKAIIGPTSDQSLILESRRAGSEEYSFTTPKCQARICVKEGNEYTVLGCAVRFESGFSASAAGGWLVGPDHVLGGDEEKYAWGSQVPVSLGGKERIALDTDLVAIFLTEKELSMIGVSVCKIGLVPGVGQLAQIVGPVGKGTTGVLKNDRVVFGRVVYEGTTVGGYSGAAYTVGNQVVGLHQCGGAVNGGYSASYVWMLVKAMDMVGREVTPEGSNKDSDTAQWMLGQFNNGKRIKWRTTGEPGLCEIFLDGQYSRVWAASMAKAFGPTWQDSNEFDNKSFARTYRDVAPDSILESGEAKSSLCPGVSSSLAKDQGLEEQNLPNVILELANLSKTQLKNIQKSAQLAVKQKSTSNGQVNIMASKSGQA